MIVFEVMNRTISVLFATRQEAEKYVCSFSTSAGLSIIERYVLGTPPEASATERPYAPLARKEFRLQPDDIETFIIGGVMVRIEALLDGGAVLAWTEQLPQRDSEEKP